MMIIKLSNHFDKKKICIINQLAGQISYVKQLNYYYLKKSNQICKTYTSNQPKVKSCIIDIKINLSIMYKVHNQKVFGKMLLRKSIHMHQQEWKSENIYFKYN